MPLDATGFVNDPQVQNDWWVLRSARELLARRGNWCRNNYHHAGGHCAVGAVYEVLNRSDRPDRTAVADDIIARRLHPLLPQRYRMLPYMLPYQIPVCSNVMKVLCVIEYNDIGARRKGDILRLFDRALADLNHVIP